MHKPVEANLSFWEFIFFVFVIFMIGFDIGIIFGRAL